MNEYNELLLTLEEIEQIEKDWFFSDNKAEKGEPEILIAKAQLDKALKHRTHGCEFCNWTGSVLNQWDNTEDCPVCKNKPWKRLDRPDREKIKQITHPFCFDGEIDFAKEACPHPNNDFCQLCEDEADQILALIPDEKEIEKQCLETWMPAQIKAEQMIKQEAKKQKWFEPMDCAQCGSTVAVSVEDNGFILLACRCRSHAIRYTDIKPEWQALSKEADDE